MSPSGTPQTEGRPPRRHAGNLPREGGRLCLDFVNTVDWRGAARPTDYLSDYAALLAWSVHAGLLAADAARVLGTVAAAHPDAAGTALQRALALREALHGLFGAAARGEPGHAGLQAQLNAELAAPAHRWRLVPAPEGWRWAPPEEASVGAETLAGLLRPLAGSAAELLASPELARVRPCGDPACGWLFLDTSRNGTRRWCNMTTCGNRAKARRHYRRQRGTAGSG